MRSHEPHGLNSWPRQIQGFTTVCSREPHGLKKPMVLRPFLRAGFTTVWSHEPQASDDLSTLLEPRKFVQDQAQKSMIK